MDDYALVVKPTSELTSFGWLNILKARTAVFVVKQNYPYQEVDDQDYAATFAIKSTWSIGNLDADYQAW